MPSNLSDYRSVLQDENEYRAVYGAEGFVCPLDPTNVAGARHLEKLVLAGERENPELHDPATQALLMAPGEKISSVNTSPYFYNLPTSSHESVMQQ